jgi:hypothetical protein
MYQQIRISDQQIRISIRISSNNQQIEISTNRLGFAINKLPTN